MRSVFRYLVPFGLFGLALAGPPGLAGDWSSWRGPTQDGRAEAPGLFTGRDFGLQLAWRIELGQGYSGTSIAGDAVVTMYTDGTSDFLGAFDAGTGKPVWRYRLGPMYEGHDGGHDGPVSTPVVSEGTVYALGADGKLVAVALADGSERWAVSLGKRFGAPEPFWGFCTTPVIWQDLVIVQVGAGGKRALAAFARSDGSVRWTCGRGTVDYRSPVLARLAGRLQLVASTSRETTGVDPSSGEVLWTLAEPISFASTPVAIGDDRLLLVHDAGASLYEVRSGTRPRRVWRSGEFRGSYATPVRYEGHLYGFTDRYLTCVDLETGDRRWRSRHPGGKGIIVVDGHLVILGARGDLVVVRATPERYRERTRCPVSDADGYSWPSFSDGVVYLRNLRHLAAVRITSGPGVTSRRAPSRNRFEEEVRALAASGSRDSVLDRLLARYESLPIVADGQVHFVYQGPARDVAIRGNMIAHLEEDPLRRLEGTDLFHRSYPIEPGARWEYQLNVDFGRIGPDPRNPRTAGRDGRGREISEVATPEWKAPAYAGPYRGDRPGRMEAVRLGGRGVRVYLPAGYRKDGAPHDLLVVTEGDAWIDEGRLPDVLNHLGEDDVASPVVAFVSGSSYRELGGAATRGYVEMLANRIVPELRRRYRVRSGAGGCAILGRRAAAVAAVHATVTHPEVFGRCIAISYGRADTVRARWISRRIEEMSREKPRFYVGWNRYDFWRPQSFDVRAQSRDLVSLLERNGFSVVDEERLDGAGWTSWRIQAGEAFRAFFPAEEPASGSGRPGGESGP